MIGFESFSTVKESEDMNSVIIDTSCLRYKNTLFRFITN